MEINQVSAVKSDLSEILSKIRDISSSSRAFSQPIKIEAPSKFNDIFSVAKGAIEKVNDLQSTSETLKAGYVTGDNSVSLSQVLIASQKSKLAFQGLLTVRNKIMEAYKEIMNMPV